eukprot:SAG11_NODE_10936_length_795_cov_1.110632_1_plen_21_part_10
MIYYKTRAEMFPELRAVGSHT